MSHLTNQTEKENKNDEQKREYMNEGKQTNNQKTNSTEEHKHTRPQKMIENLQ